MNPPGFLFWCQHSAASGDAAYNGGFAPTGSLALPVELINA